MNILNCGKYAVCLPPPDTVGFDCPGLCPQKRGCKNLFLNADSIISSQQGDHEIMDGILRGGKIVYSAYTVTKFLKSQNKDIILHSPFFC